MRKFNWAKAETNTPIQYLDDNKYWVDAIFVGIDNFTEELIVYNPKQDSFFLRNHEDCKPVKLKK